MIPMLAYADIDLLIEGETGTGKALLARRIHAAGKRRRHRLLGVACAAYPDALLDTDLFARVGTGSVVAASRGTLLLDDLDQASRALQARLTALVEARALVESRIDQFLTNKGTRTVDSYHRELGNIMWEYCGMERTDEGLRKGIALIRELKDEFSSNVRVLGTADSLNQSLEKAGRVADFLELGELMCIDALHRNESCGGHFRAESQTEDGEALRHDEEYAYVAAWEWAGEDSIPVLHKEDLTYTAIEMKQRSYK